MKKNTTSTLKSLAVFALAVASIPAFAQTQEKPEKKKVEKRIEIEAENENGEEKVTITTTVNGDKTVEVMEGAEARVWMEEHESGQVVGVGEGNGENVRVFVTVDEENGEKVKRVRVVSDGGNTEDVHIIMKEGATNGSGNAYRYEVNDGEDGDDVRVWVSDGEDVPETLSFKPDPTSGMYKLSLDLDKAHSGELYVKDADGEKIFSEEIDGDGLHEFQVKVENKGAFTVGFDSKEMVIVKKLMIE